MTTSNPMTDEKKTANISVRMYPSNRETIKEAAKKVGLSPSAYMLFKALQAAQEGEK